MLNFIVYKLFCSLLLFTTTTSAQPYKATEHFLLDCGSSNTTTISDQKWDGDERSEFVPSNITRTSFASTPDQLDTSVPHIPYSTARIFNTSPFTYKFHVSPGPKFLRFYFYPATYSSLSANQSFFSLSSNGYSLLTKFSALVAALFLAETRSDAREDGPPVPHFVKEFLVYVKDTQYLNVVFTPEPNSYAFINGIEIVSMPDDLYFNAAKNPKPVGMSTGPVINDDTALENVYRLNMGGGEIAGNNDTGMFRSWDKDDNYIYGASLWWTPVNKTQIVYTRETPSYTAPEQVYETQRSFGKQLGDYNLTWRLPVDSGFFYMLRLHLCNIIPQYTKQGQAVFTVFVNNQTAELEVDLLVWTLGSGYPVIKDYIVFVSPHDSRKSKQDLWIALHPYSNTDKYKDGYLNGLEVFRLSMNGNLSSPNPQVSPTKPPSSLVHSSKRKKKSPPYAMVIGGVIGGLVLLSIVPFIVLRQRKRVNHHSTTSQKQSRGLTPSDSSLPSDRSRHFTLTEVKSATNNFNDNCVIGNGGFGKVYKGYVDNAATTVAIKRLNPSSSQGFHEFHTEIEMLSKLRHVHLVPLIGYCNENGEMILVYDYMAHGTLREHLYKTKNPLLSWETRLSICIGAAKGLHYLHTGAKRTIIHRDVKSTNILLDENWVAKVSDFGLSKVGSRDPLQKHVSTIVKGSIGYMDPEYCRNQKLTEKSDVYSFGVVLFEVLCARPAIVPRVRDEQVNLAEWGKTCYRRGTLVEIIDEKISDKIAPRCLRKFSEVANSCLHQDGCERPAMDEVVWGLEFALELQKAYEKTGGNVSEAMTENQELAFLSRNADNAIEDEGNVAY